MIKLFLSALITFTSLYSLAGNEVGNGGDAVVCKKNDKIVSVELLDFYEYRLQNGKSSILINNKTSEKSQLEGVLKTLKQLNQRLSNHYQKKADLFLTQAAFLDNADLVDIKDSKHIVLPKNKDCAIEQIAIYNKKHKAGKKFVINNQLWLKMDKTNQAGLILHEIIYEHFYKLGEKDSIKARYVNSLLFSKNFKDMKTSEFYKKIKDLKIPIYRK